MRAIHAHTCILAVSGLPSGHVELGSDRVGRQLHIVRCGHVFDIVGRGEHRGVHFV